jgi:RimJ/RimL family protein N-acetyltransferase
MSFVQPVVMRDRGLRLEPLGLEHAPGLADAAADGELWKLRITSVPEPQDTRAYIETALEGRAQGHRFAFAVLDDASGQVLGSTSFHDILPAVHRVEIGWTWYRKSVQRTHVNTTAKLLMMGHAFDQLGLPRGGLAHRQLQLRQPARHRTPGRQEGRRDPRPCTAPRRHHPRHRDVQHAQRRMARGRAQLLYLLQRHAQD